MVGTVNNRMPWLSQIKIYLSFSLKWWSCFIVSKWEVVSTTLARYEESARCWKLLKAAESHKNSSIPRAKPPIIPPNRQNHRPVPKDSLAGGLSLSDHILSALNKRSYHKDTNWSIDQRERAMKGHSGGYIHLSHQVRQAAQIHYEDRDMEEKAYHM